MLTTGKKGHPASHQARVGRLTIVKHHQRHFYSYLVNNHRFFSFFCSAASATSDHAIKPVKAKKGFPLLPPPPPTLSVSPKFPAAKDAQSDSLLLQKVYSSLHPYVNQKQPFLWFLWLWLGCSTLSRTPNTKLPPRFFPLSLSPGLAIISAWEDSQEHIPTLIR